MATRRYRAQERFSVSHASDRTGSPFEPDILLADQMSYTSRHGRYLEGEKRLMLAVLEDAVDCYKKCAFTRDPRGQKLFNETCRWVASNDSRWLYSFYNICHELSLDPSYIRKGLRKWREEQLSRLPVEINTT